MGGVVYVLCMILSFACSVMLWRGYQANKFRLLFWSSIGFLGFAINNALLFVDLEILSQATDLSIVRTLPALVGVVVMIYGLITETV
jgi:hypothetical protein